LKKSWNGKSLRDLASDALVNEAGRYVWLYGPLSNVGHGQVMSVWAYMDEDSNGDVVLDEKPSKKEVGLAMTGALGMAIEACVGIAVLLDVLTVNVMARVAKLRTEFEAMNAELEALDSATP
jgi:hypothetical protein